MTTASKVAAFKHPINHKEHQILKLEDFQVLPDFTSVSYADKIYNIYYSSFLMMKLDAPQSKRCVVTVFYSFAHSIHQTNSKKCL